MLKQLKYILLLVVISLVLQPEPAEANPRFFAAAVAALTRWGVKLVKNTHYARCNTRNVPAGIQCPSVVFGWGQTRNDAQSMARDYATTFGNSACGRYVGHCEIRKLDK